MKSERIEVTYGPPAKARFEVEMITDTAGYQQTGGSGASCWGYNQSNICLLYTSPSPRDGLLSRMPSSA